MHSLFTLTLLFSSTLALPSPVVQIRESLITIPIAKRFNATGPLNIAEADRARARGLIGQILHGIEGTLEGILGEHHGVGVPVTNAAVSYLASVGVGNPPTQYNLIIDTGSSNTWVGASKPYTRTSTSSKTSNTVEVAYGSGNFSGNEFIDQVTLAKGLVIRSQSIGVATTSNGFPNVDGILGIGPTDLTVGTLKPDRSASIPTVTDSLFSQGTISSNLIGVSFEPTTSPSETNGEITFGGVDSSKFTGEITYVPITSTSPANTFWGIDQSITYGATTILSTTAGIVDTGTTLILIATDAFSAYQKQTGGIPDSNTGLLSVTQSQFDNLHSLFFHIGGTTFELTPNAQRWPRSLNSDIGGTTDGIYLIVSDSGAKSGQGLDFLNGQAFLERFYSVYDTGRKRVGLATTPFTTATTN